MQQKIENRLREGFSINHLSVVNDSHNHKGHAGDDGSGESHFIIEISAAEFNGIGTLECHRMVYGILSKEMADIHALSIQIIS